MIAPDHDPRVVDIRTRRVVDKSPYLTPDEAEVMTGCSADELARHIDCFRVGTQRRMRRFRLVDVESVRSVGLDAFVASQLREREADSERRASEVGRVYFAEALGTDRVKIGWTSKAVSVRLRDLQTASPFALVEITSLAGSKHQERWLHDNFADLRILPTSEWFYLRKPLSSYIEIVRTERRWPR